MYELLLLACDDDSEYAKNFYRELERRNISVCLEKLQRNMGLSREYISGLIKGCYITVVLWSALATKDESLRAVTQVALDSRKLFQVLIEDIAPPTGFSHVSYLSLAGWDGTSDDITLSTVVSHIEKTSDQAP
jgi:hypothetical protein